jgi:hypothetical protein
MASDKNMEIKGDICKLNIIYNSKLPVIFRRCHSRILLRESEYLRVDSQQTSGLIISFGNC